MGILPHWPVNHGMSTSLYYSDPDGNEFEINVDNFDTAAEAHAFMQTDEHMQDPSGVDFDAEVLVQRVRGWENECSIKKRPVVWKGLIGERTRYISNRKKGLVNSAAQRWFRVEDARQHLLLPRFSESGLITSKDLRHKDSSEFVASIAAIPSYIARKDNCHSFPLSSCTQCWPSNPDHRCLELDASARKFLVCPH